MRYRRENDELIVNKFCVIGTKTHKTRKEVLV